MSNQSDFKAGDAVSWESQAAGFSKVKTGVILQVVQPKVLPSREQFPQLYKGPGVGGYRNHISYVIGVPGKTARAAVKIYWPRASLLRSAT